MKSAMKIPENRTAAGAGNERYAQIEPFLTRLRQHRRQLTAQQYRTLKGQAVAGQLEAAEKGLWKLITD